jgi:hypothetical protein
METILTTSIREKLKGVVFNELEGLEETLKLMDPEKRLNIVCKLLPFVCPKVESVSHKEGEPLSW